MMTILVSYFYGLSSIEGFYLNGIFVLLYSMSLYFNFKGKFSLGKSVQMISINLQIFINFLAFGPEAKVDLYFIVLFILPFLIFSVSEKNLILLFILISIFLQVLGRIYLFYNLPILNLNTQQIIFWQISNMFFLYLILGGMIYNFFKATHEAEEMFLEEQERSEGLLLNILPHSIAKRLKSGEGVIAEHYENVTVLFSDIVGFTEYSQKVSPQILVNKLNELFSEFDDLSVRFDLEKIKTIGDAYMVISGAPEENPLHAEKILDMAIEMLNVLYIWQKKESVDLGLRIGIHTGSIVAGVIGKKKFIFDIWGDTVNTASRMESHGEPGKIHLSGVTYDLLKDKYNFSSRGKIKIKGKGEMETYFFNPISS